MSAAEIDEITTKAETKNNKDNTKCAAQACFMRVQMHADATSVRL